MPLTEIVQQVVIQFEFIVVEHRLVQLSTGDLSLLSGLEFFGKGSEGLFLNNLVLSALKYSFLIPDFCKCLGIWKVFTAC